VIGATLGVIAAVLMIIGLIYFKSKDSK